MLSGSVLGNLINQQMLAMGLKGTKAPLFSTAVGTGIVTSILASNIYVGQSTGIGTGAGKGTGMVLGIVGPAVGMSIYGQMQSQSLKGTKSLQLAMAIGNAFAMHILSGQIQSVSTPVVVGTGTGKLQGIAGPLIATSIMGFFTAMGFTGTKLLQMATAIGNGIASSMASAQVMTVIVGGGYPPSPLSGVDTGKLM